MSILVVHKPSGISSRSIYNLLYAKKYIICSSKVSHAGVLDVMAEGVVIILTDDSIKKQNEFTEHNKTYYCQFLLGIETHSNDITGKIQKYTIKHIIDKYMVLCMISYFSNKKYAQKAPQISNRKVNGICLRKDKSRTVSSYGIAHILSMKLVSHICDTIELVVDVTSGFYVRSLAREIGYFLGVYCTTSRIFRLSINHYSVVNSIKI